MSNIRKILNKILSPKINYQPLIEVRIFKDALLFNLHGFQGKYPNLIFAPVLKSNAYGHGMVQVAEVLDNQDVAFFMVDSFYEALTLRQHGIKTKILVLGYCRENELLSAKLNEVSFGIIDLGILKNLSAKLTRPLNIHLKINTGMNRQGIMESEIAEAIKAIKSNRNINLEGLCTHFADADGADNRFTLGQIAKWNSTAVQFKKEFSYIRYFHASNTAGAAYADKIEANVSRLGIGLYGINPSREVKLELKPVMELVSVLSSIKKIGAGEKVGYGVTFEATKPMIVATVPVGYTEGVDRRLSNKGSYQVCGIYCPIVGRVSMNMSSIDITEVPDVKLEDEVFVISANKNDKNSIENLAKLCECIPYEILVHIPQHLRRTIM
ncbi:MAG: alanine racemase [Candidatus Doudnabacteria bacterium]|nr:alanine racemase [Candidatus Doudnabacteria bacterium]